MLTIDRIAASLILLAASGVVGCDKSDVMDAADAGTRSEGGHSAASGSSGHGGKVAAGGAGHIAAGGEPGGGGRGGHVAVDGESGSGGHAEAAGHSGSAGYEGYHGPTVGTAKRFAVLAYDSVTTANATTLVGSIGVSSAAISVITGFSDPATSKFGSDSLAPNDALTRIAQGDVTTLVGNIDKRACDDDLTDVVGGLTGDVTLHPGVTCMNSFSADVLVDGHVYLDAEGDANAFFIIRGNKTLTVADGAKVVLMNEARNCGVFWRISEAVTIGKTVEFRGTLIAGTAITMKTASSLDGRALAQTAGVQLDANTITAPSDGECPHTQ